MNYRESEREKALRIRDELFKDPGNGEHLKVKYPFVLEQAEKNLWTKNRKEAIKYFVDNKIVVIIDKIKKPCRHYRQGGVY